MVLALIVVLTSSLGSIWPLASRIPHSLAFLFPLWADFLKFPGQFVFSWLVPGTLLFLKVLAAAFSSLHIYSPNDLTSSQSFLYHFVSKALSTFVPKAHRCVCVCVCVCIHISVLSLRTRQLYPPSHVTSIGRYFIDIANSKSKLTTFPHKHPFPKFYFLLNGNSAIQSRNLKSTVIPLSSSLFPSSD